jgi:hypothetical protein
MISMFLSQCSIRIGCSAAPYPVDPLISNPALGQLPSLKPLLSGAPPLVCACKVVVTYLPVVMVVAGATDGDAKSEQGRCYRQRQPPRLPVFFDSHQFARQVQRYETQARKCNCQRTCVIKLLVNVISLFVWQLGHHKMCC